MAAEASLLFAALGDGTRLELVRRLAGGAALSISQLAEGFELSRQAVTKHLRVLEGVGLVHNRRAGRERIYQLDPEPLAEMREYLDAVAAQWDDALGRLKGFVEE